MNFTDAWCKAHLTTPLSTPPGKSPAALYLGMANIHDEMLLERIRFMHDGPVVPCPMTEAEILRTIRARFADQVETLQEGKAGSWESEPVINLVDSLIDKALEENASDIHLEPTEKELKVRFRIDGLLQLHRSLPGWLKDPILVRLKLLAQVDITDKRIPHDGSFKFQSVAGTVRIRLSTLPVQFGETCVLRLLPAKDEGGTLSDLQFSPKILAELRRIFAIPQGLLLITGPTGSGKTTTLYAGLREIIGKKINVTTIEDPVEYCLSGANQVQVNEKCGFTFAAALRSILRQDPDVILVGEIRDEETARIALRAAQTGHLVLATLHTNSAMGATARLQDLGISKASLQDSLLGVVAQRLLRKKAGGRIATLELLRPDGTYVDGTLRQYADRLVQNGLVERDELLRVLGN
ncbi:MAG: type II/IV secretion system protein [Fibrobacter sp.]|nr:type II/IV secretion system protein [Fibrobacter sp.]